MDGPDGSPDDDTADTVDVWQCIGCGRIEAPQPCIGVCQDRKVVLVGKVDLDRARREIECLHARIDALHSLLVRFTRASPHADGCQASWTQLQDQARRALARDDAGRG